jgi:hypothetical protein
LCDSDSFGGSRPPMTFAVAKQQQETCLTN